MSPCKSDARGLGNGYFDALSRARRGPDFLVQGLDFDHRDSLWLWSTLPWAGNSRRGLAFQEEAPLQVSHKNQGSLRGSSRRRACWWFRVRYGHLVDLRLSPVFWVKQPDGLECRCVAEVPLLAPGFDLDTERALQQWYFSVLGPAEEFLRYAFCHRPGHADIV